MKKGEYGEKRERRVPEKIESRLWCRSGERRVQGKKRKNRIGGERKERMGQNKKESTEKI